jgi:hypothetical protein
MSTNKKDSDMITEIANLVIKKTMEQTHDVQARVDAYLDKYLEKIVLAALGVTESSWSDRGWELEKVNGYSGYLRDYVRGLGKRLAVERAKKLMPTIIDKKVSSVMKNGLEKDCISEFRSAYREHLFKLVDEHLKNDENEFHVYLEKIVSEVKVRAEIMTKDEMQALVASVERGDGKLK